jgi:hypothetical protein
MSYVCRARHPKPAAGAATSDEVLRRLLPMLLKKARDRGLPPTKIDRLCQAAKKAASSEAVSLYTLLNRYVPSKNHFTLPYRRPSPNRRRVESG